jgi:primosomal protein N' (replication factor Y) (superfamily II helicase)
VTGRFVDVALPLPLWRPYTYAVPAALDARAVVGARVLVPVRGRTTMGFIVGERDTPPPGTLQPVRACPDAEPVLSADLLATARWIARHYHAPLGVTLKAMLPAALTGVARPQAAERTERVLELVDAMPTLQQRDAAFARAPQQRAVFELLERLGGRAPLRTVTEPLGASDAVVRALVTRGVVRVVRDVVARDPFAARAPGAAAAHDPTPAQAAALAALQALPPGGAALLFGVTGSGKTLVYLEYLKRVLAAGQGAIVLVPEIALTPQTVDRFRAVFGDAVAVLHSGLSDGERHDAWRALQRGQKRIAVGARSAVFAPVPQLGAIVVDEEHEASYKQGEAPRYHARDVAARRARETGARLVLGSATPALETWAAAQAGRLTLLRLPERPGAGVLPQVDVVDLRQERLDLLPDAATRRRRGVLSAPLEAALRETVHRGEQAILLLNRRGFARFVQCGDCGDVRVCPDCSVSLTYHQAPEGLVCHHCQHREPFVPRCGACGGERARPRGVGTQQLETMVAELLPAARLARMDVDTTRGKWAHATILDRFGAGDLDVLVGTQMIAKGLDFPNVTLVGVIDADVGINLPDFRASERAFQLLSQVAGRAGRGARRGRVLVQTRSPEHHAVRWAVAHDFEGFAAEELAARTMPPYPPTRHLTNVLLSAPGADAVAVQEEATRAAAWAREAARRHDLPVEVIGPAPCPIERVQQRWRWHFYLRSEVPAALGRLGQGLAQAYDPADPAVRVTLDRDPVSLL